MTLENLLDITEKEGCLDEQDGGESVEVDGGEGKEPGFSLHQDDEGLEIEKQQNSGIRPIWP